MHPFAKAQMDPFEFSTVEWLIQEQRNCLSFVGCVHSFQNVLDEQHISIIDFQTPLRIDSPTYEAYSRRGSLHRFK